MKHKTVLFYATYRCFPALIRRKGTAFFWNVQVKRRKNAHFFHTPYLYTRAQEKTPITMRKIGTKNRTIVRFNVIV